MTLFVAGPFCMGLIFGGVLLFMSNATVGRVIGAEQLWESGTIAVWVTSSVLAFVLNCLTAAVAGMLASKVRAAAQKLLQPRRPGCFARPAEAAFGKLLLVPREDEESTDCGEVSPAPELEFDADDPASEEPASPSSSRGGSDAEESPAVRQRPRLFGSLPEPECAIRRVKATLNKMTNDSFKKLTATLVKEIQDSTATDYHCQFVESVAVELVTKGTREKGFVSLYADVTVVLFKALAGLGKGTEVVFKESMVCQCQNLLHKYLPAVAIDGRLSDEEQFEEYIKHKTVMLGNAMLTGELVVRSLFPPGAVFFFAKPLLHERSTQTLETLCVLLSTVGQRFDSTSGRGRNQFDALFREVEVLADDETLSFRTRCIVKELVEKRRAGWVAAEQAAEPTPKEGSPASPSWRGAPEQRPAAGPRIVADGTEAHGQASETQAPDDRAESDLAASRHFKQLGSGKWVARIEIGIDDAPSFQVTSSVIGRGGGNMKAIVAAAPGTKLRIRGRGSGFLEGVYRREADEPLMICVSSPTEEILAIAIEKVEELLCKVRAGHNESKLMRRT